MFSESPEVAQEASNRSARASLDGVLTRSTASILNATRYSLSLSIPGPLTACFLLHEHVSPLLIPNATSCQGSGPAIAHSSSAASPPAQKDPTNAASQ